MIHPKLTGKEFEQILMDWSAREEKAGRLTMGRYGVESLRKDGEVLQIQSKPDFEGVLAFPAARQFIIEAKVCGGPTFRLHKTFIKPRQVQHMLTRARFGVPCFLLVHFTERQMAKGVEPAFTVAIPVHPDNPIWQAFLDETAAAKREKRPFRESLGISRTESLRIGSNVSWAIPARCKNPLPDLLPLLDPSGMLRSGENQPLELFGDSPLP